MAEAIDWEALVFGLDEPIPGVRLLPVVHDRVDLASIVRAAIQDLDPAALAVELPTTLQDAVTRAVRRLPRISLVVSEQKGAEALVWTSAPGEPFAEALRWAEEREKPTFFIDPDLPYQERHRDPVPDPYAVWHLGPERFLSLLVEQGASWDRTDEDRAREAGMAHHIQEARRQLAGGPLLVLLGSFHVRAVAQLLKKPQPLPFARTRRSHVQLRHLHPESLTSLLPDPPLAHAVFELLREGAPPEEADLKASINRKVSLSRHGLRLITGEKDASRRERAFELARFATRHASRDTARGRYAPDRLKLQQVVWQVAAVSYREQTDESTKIWQRRLFADFARRQARIQGLLVPGLYEWVVAARGVGDDNLAWEAFDTARTFPWQEARAEIATARVDGEELDLGTRRITFRKRFFRVKQRPVRVPIRERPAAADPDKWIEAFDTFGLCSYPSEDLVIEDYARFLQRKAISILSAERKRTEPFTTTLLDGIDIRETLRNVHDGRVYVQELARAAGDAGSVVVIFDRDRSGDRFPYRMTWIGEHQQESDMAFYATTPTEHVVGPGIMRATYGGFMMTYPPRRLFDVWQDPDYRFAREKAEVLLMSAIDYSEEKIVVHVGVDPPAPSMRSYAARQGKRVIHIPLGALSPITLNKIRVVHLLAGHDKRAIAKDYIW